MSLKDCILAVWQGFIQFIDEVIWNSKESSLACLPEFIKILWFRLPCFLFHPTPDMLNDVHVWWLGWPILEHLDLLRLEELWCRDGSMWWSTILAAKFGPFYGWECKRQLRLLDILDYWCCLPPCRSLAHPHTGCNPRPWFFRHQTWLFSWWITDPCRLQ